MRAPGFWRRDGWVSRLLAPFGGLYGAATARRLRRPGLRVPATVICCGNVTAGGTGKTIVALAIADILINAGHRPAFISRGYGGRLKTPTRVDPARHTARDVGDEPLLLAARAPCFIGRDRAAVARFAAGFTHLILDDGLQNPSLVKDISFLVIDGGAGFGNGRMIPAGPLREPVAAAARRVQAAILIGEDEFNAQAQLPPGLPVLKATLVPVYGKNDDDPRGRRVVGFAGIGRPGKFRASLIEAGAAVAEFIAFPDHHFYTETEISRLQAEAIRFNARLATTRKDLVRLPPAARAGIAVLDVELRFTAPAALANLLCCTAASSNL